MYTERLKVLCKKVCYPVIKDFTVHVRAANLICLGNIKSGISYPQKNNFATLTLFEQRLFMKFSKNCLNIVFPLLVLPQLALSSFSHAAFAIWNRLNGFLGCLKSHHQILSCGPIISVPLSHKRIQSHFLTKLGSIKLRTLSGLAFSSLLCFYTTETCIYKMSIHLPTFINTKWDHQ